MTDAQERGRPIEILLVEDNPGDVRLTREMLRGSKISNTLNVARDGEDALAYLRREGSYGKAARPDLVLLDLNLPKKDGRDVLQTIKEDVQLRAIPVIVLTTSTADEDIFASYQLHANCYIGKPVDLAGFNDVVRAIQEFWLRVVRLPAAHA